MSKKEDGDIFLSDQSDGLLMINKEERKLLKQVLLITMGSKNSKAYPAIIRNRLSLGSLRLYEKSKDY